MRSDTNDWFELWYEDKESILATMIRNMQADLDAGYNYFGNSIIKQRQDIDDYKEEFDAQMENLKMMDSDSKVNRWCYLDLKKRGAI